ncbi:MAG TPA: HNH endonuclease signature motif containing protein [Ktedonobacterales bacterium]|nr:HNH endonuclease signature motif containing protein [Ktedonobacterales bacterium]
MLGEAKGLLVNRVYVFGSIVALAVVAVFGVTQASASRSAPGLKRIHDPRHVTYSIRIKSCRTRHRGQLPSRSCTPGSVDPSVTQTDIRSTICRAGWTDKVRPPEWQTEHAKYQIAYPAYHIRGSAQSELDHLVPLELGGSNDITNLWPELGPIPNAKDKVENALNHAVCEGRVSLTAAQRAIASDWLTAEARLGLTPSPRPSPSPSQTRKPTQSPSPSRSQTPSPAPPPAAWCWATASVYNAQYDENDVYVHSNQPYRDATASAEGTSWSRETNASGYTVIWLNGPPPGAEITVTVGGATCYTSD